MNWRSVTLAFVLVGWPIGRATGQPKPADDPVAEALARLDDPYVRDGGQSFRFLCEAARRDPAVVERLAEAMRNPRYSRAHLEALAVLGEIGPAAQPALGELRKAMRESKGSLQLAATEAVLRVTAGDDEAIDFLKGLIRTGERGSRLEVLNGVARAGPAVKELVPVLLEVVSQGTPLEGAKALDAIGAMGPSAKQATTALVQFTRSTDHQVGVAAVRNLVRVAPDAPEVLPALLRTMRDYGFAGAEASEQVLRFGQAARPRLVEMVQGNPGPARSYALHAVRFLPEAASPLAEVIGAIAATSNVEWDRENAVAALANLGERGVGPLVKLLEDRAVQPKATVIAALSTIGGPAKRAAPALVRAMTDRWSPREDRLAAIETVGRIGPAEEEAVPALIAMVRGSDLGMREAAIEALGRIGPSAKSAAAVLGEVIEADRPMGKYRPAARKAADATAQIGGSEVTVVPVLMEMLRCPSPREAVEGLGRIGHPASKALPALRILLASENTRIRIATALAVTRIDPEASDGIRALVALVDSPTGPLAEQVRGEAIDALGAIGPRAAAAVPTLWSVVDGWTDNSARAALAIYWMHPGDREATDSLVRTLASDDNFGRWRAIEALKAIGPPARRASPALWRLVVERRNDAERDEAVRAMRLVENGRAE